jgi:hypothetical protein
MKELPNLGMRKEYPKVILIAVSMALHNGPNMNNNNTPSRAGSAIFISFLAIAFTQTATALTVVTPPAGFTVVAAGQDHATQVIGDAWDMSNPLDIDTEESQNLNPQTFSGGIFSSTITSAAGATLWPLFASYDAQAIAMSRGQLFPIDTSVYRYFSMKLKVTGGTMQQPNRLIFVRDGSSFSTGTFGSSYYEYLTPGQWTIQSWDLYNDTYKPGDGSGYNYVWTDFAKILGFRVDLVNYGSTNVQIDWMRLTAAPAPNQYYAVSWSDTAGNTYVVTAIDNDGARFQFASGVSGTSYNADMSRLAPGDYTMEVKRVSDGTTALSPGKVHINTPAQIQISAPSIRGEQTKSYAIVEKGAQWGPISAASFRSVPNFSGISYTNPVGSFNGRPINNDPQFVMNTTGHLINADYYRSLCMTFEVFGPRDILNGSVGRLFWGQSLATLGGTYAFILDGGLTEYCIPDLADMNAVPLLPSPPPHPWTGTQGIFRMDPHEFAISSACTSTPTPQNCRDVRLDSLIIAPFAEANPAYTVQWSLADADYSGTGGSVLLSLDPDHTYGNGNEIPVAQRPFVLGSQQYNFVANKNIPDGTYRLLVIANDGTNTVAQYAAGPIVVRNDDVIFRDGFDPLP